METKYWHLKFDGERPLDEIQSAVGRSGGLLIRVHVEGGKTQVYFSADKSVVTEISETLRAIKAPTLVSERSVTKLR